MRNLHAFAPGYPTDLDPDQYYRLALTSLEDWNYQVEGAYAEYVFAEQRPDQLTGPTGTYKILITGAMGWIPSDIAYIRERYFPPTTPYPYILEALGEAIMLGRW